MASVVDVVATPAEANYSTFDNLRLGRSSQQVVGRLLRFWDARNVKKDGEFMGIILLLLDEKSSVIHCFIPAARAGQFQSFLKEGLIFQIGVFEVGRCTQLYKITDHPFVIRFLPSTTIVKVDRLEPTIATEKFMLRNSNHLQALANTNLELPDVVGQIKYVQGSKLDDPTSTQRLVVRFMVDSSVVVYLALWDEAAATFRSYLSSGETMSSVMLVTTINPKMFGGNLYLNSTPATRFYSDQSLEAISKFAERFEIDATKPFAKADTSEGIQKKETLTIAELHKFISNSNEQTQEADFLCKAKAIGVIQKKGWFYVSCAKCSRKLDKYGTSLQCTKCISTNVIGVARYRVEVAVHDGEDGATFVIFDTEMAKLTNKTAASLILEANGGLDDEIPNCIHDIVGKQFLFQIRVTPFNFTPNHRSFTVSKITLDTPKSGSVQVDEVLNNPSSQTTLTQNKTSNERIEHETNYGSAIMKGVTRDAIMVEDSECSNACPLTKKSKRLHKTLSSGKSSVDMAVNLKEASNESVVVKSEDAGKEDNTHGSNGGSLEKTSKRQRE